jgi:hypothetical protein
MKRLFALLLIAATLLTACKKERYAISGPEDQRCLLKEAKFVGNTFLKIEYDPSRRMSRIKMGEVSYRVTYRPDGKIDKLVDDSNRFVPFRQYSYPNARQIIMEVGSQGTVQGKIIYTMTGDFVTTEEYYANNGNAFILNQVIEIKRDVFGNRLTDKIFYNGKLSGTYRYTNYDGKKNPLAVLPYGLLQGFDSPQNFGKSTYESTAGEPILEDIIFLTYNEYNYATQNTKLGQSMDFTFECFK